VPAHISYDHLAFQYTYKTMALIVILTLLFFYIPSHPARFKISRLAITSYCFIFSLENRAAGRRNKDSIVGSAHV
ncbi:hypothetical protein, partial [Klebsiella pneumoniae]